MGAYSTEWVDEENNRIVTLAVAYEIRSDRVEIASVTPASITFLDPETRNSVRHIRVHTETGRALLARQYRDKVGLNTLHAEVAKSLQA